MRLPRLADVVTGVRLGVAVLGAAGRALRWLLVREPSAPPLRARDSAIQTRAARCAGHEHEDDCRNPPASK